MATARFVQAEPVRLNVELVLTEKEAHDLYQTLGSSVVGNSETYVVLWRLLTQSKKETTTR